MNLMAFVQRVYTARDPYKAAADVFRQQAGGNPALMNAADLLEHRDIAGFQTVVKNICYTSGVNPEMVMNQLQGMIKHR